MGMTEIKEKILEEARAEADRIRQGAEAEAERITREAMAESEKIRALSLTQARQAAAEEKLARIIPARLEAKRLLLETKQQLLAEVFSGLPPEVREAREIEVAKHLYG
jgi:V/A-type H+-transporting ATPase subunit E